VLKMEEITRTAVGFGIRDITPSVMVPMSGYDLRTAIAEGVHDPLSVRALAIGGEDPALLIAFDLLGISAYHAEPLRKRLSERFGIRPERIAASAIHTHAAPKSIFQSFACYDPSYAAYVLKQAEEAAAEAIATREERTAFLSETLAEGVACFRDAGAEGSRFAMPSETIWWEKEGCAPVLMTLFTCHPTVLNEQNLRMSRDLVWGCEKALLTRIPGAKAIFFNGACADISTRYTRRASTFEEAERLGAIWAGRILESREQAQAVSEADGLKAAASTLYVPPADYFTGEKRAQVLAHLNQKITACPDERQKREYAACRSVLERKNYGIDAAGNPRGGEEVYLSALSLGSVKLVFLPFEYARKDAALLERDCERRFGGRCLVICYSNGYEGYLPSGRPLDEDSGYEDMASNFRSDAKLLAAEAVNRLLEEMENSAGGNG